MALTGLIIIGRNEGDRLRFALESARSIAGPVVYVDSGSTDDSIKLARSLGAEAVELETDIPFTAARARNEGFRRLMRLAPDVNYVQFIDGDCEIAPGWLDAAAKFLDEHADYAVVCGRRRERNPGRSIYNRLCDCEWDTPIGDASACGGDSMMRADVFRAVGGFAAEVIAGEEPELCVRVRAAGGKIYRIDHEMTLHDADMTRFSQWWRRTMRGGFAFALGTWMHGRAHGHWVRECARIWLWAAAVPFIVLALLPFTHGASLLILLAYPLLAYRAMQWRRRCGDETKIAALYGAFCVIAKWAELAGQLKFLLSRLRRSQVGLIEYKQPVQVH